MATKWVQEEEGIRYREHAKRLFGIRPDRYYVIRYRVDEVGPDGEAIRVRKEEPIGWESQNEQRDHKGRKISMLDVARKTLAALKDAQRTGKGPATIEATRIEAAHARAEAVANASLESAKNITLREYWPVYLQAAKLKKKTKSWQTEDGYFRNWIDELLGHIPMREIGLVQWDGLMAALTDGGLSPRTRQYVALTLRQCLDHAYMRKLIPESPPRAKHVGATLKPDSNRRTRTLSNREFQAILSALAERDQAAYNIAFFCAMTGCRFGEAAALQWQDVDFGRCECTFRATKNGQDRTIPLMDSLVDFMRGLAPDKGLVFPNGNGTVYRQTPQPFRDAVDGLGLNEGRAKLDKVVFHTLRHTAATMMAQANTPLPELMALAGWKTASMALRYAHSNDAGRRRAMSALEGMMQTEPAKVIEIHGGKK